MDLGLNDRVFIVTAASSGLGFASAEQLVAEGAKVVLVARRADVLAEKVNALGEQNAVALAADLGDPTVPEAACKLALKQFQRLDGALISVGGPPKGTALENTDQQWTDAFNSVFLAALRTVRAVVAAATTDLVALALVLSSSVKSPVPGLAISNGLRPGLGMLVKELADELGPEGTRVLGLMPGTVFTERIQYLHGGADDPAAMRRNAEAAIPLRRLGEPSEFGKVAAFVLSPAASYLTGSVLAVDGGAMRSL